MMMMMMMILTRGDMKAKDSRDETHETYSRIQFIRPQNT
jgi:hypothetical protein